MIANKYGKIVTVISDAGRVGEPNLEIYSGAKAGRCGLHARDCEGPSAAPESPANLRRARRDSATSGDRARDGRSGNGQANAEGLPDQANRRA